MKTMVKSALVTVALLLGIAAVAMADFCINVEVAGFDMQLVGKGFSLPAKGACNEFRGFILSEVGNFWANGQSCGTSDGTHVTFALFAVSAEYGLESYYLLLNRTTLDGTGRHCFAEEGGSCGSLSIEKVPCSPSPKPIPNF